MDGTLQLPQSPWRPSPELVYGTIRAEILEQKRCQFQLFGAALTVTSAILALGATKDVTHAVYLGTIIMNVVSSAIILDKAASIQRMVGYLQLMESRLTETAWRWEYHLDLFRVEKAICCERDDGRKHSYVRNVGLILLSLASLASWLMLQPTRPIGGVDPVTNFWHSSMGADSVLGLCVVALGLLTFVVQWRRLVFGNCSGKSVRSRWEAVLKKT